MVICTAARRTLTYPTRGLYCTHFADQRNDVTFRGRWAPMWLGLPLPPGCPEAGSGQREGTQSCAPSQPLEGLRLSLGWHRACARRPPPSTWMQPPLQTPGAGFLRGRVLQAERAGVGAWRGMVGRQRRVRSFPSVGNPVRDSSVQPILRCTPHHPPC